MLDWLDRGSQVLGIGPMRYPHSTVLSLQRSARLKKLAEYMYNINEAKKFEVPHASYMATVHSISNLGLHELVRLFLRTVAFSE